MPWLQGERGRTYYASEEATQTPNQYRRLHLNEWVGAESEFIPIAWWDACLKPPWPLKPGEDTPLVLAVDAGVSNDYFGLTIGCRIPGIPDDKPPQVALREAWIWKPPKGGKISFDEPYQVVTRLIQEYNVVEVCYDSHELVAFMQQLMANQVVNCFEFSQQTGRDKSDKLLYDLIMGRRIQHSGNDEVREHLSNCAAKVPKDEDNKLRIIKKSETRKIDLAVCLSMMCYEILRLNI